MEINNTLTSNTEELQYLNLINKVLNEGYVENTRNGITKSIFGNMMRFSLYNNKIPIITTKKTAWKTCLKELLWFISGETNNNILQSQGVHIWDDNASTDYLKTCGLDFYAKGELGPIYGHQWRNFNGTWVSQNSQINDNVNFIKGEDQLQNIINILKNPETRTSRRLVLSAWNPSQLSQMALPPCHILCQFNVHDGNKLSCALYQRSGDIGLGICFNIASYSFLTHLIAHHCGLEAFEFVYFLGNAHIYEEHYEPLKLQLQRIPFEFPTIDIINIKNNINDYNIDDFKINNYEFHEPIKMKMIP